MAEQNLKAVVTEDPLRSQKIGAAVQFDRALVSGSNAQPRPDFVRNWGEFRGALLAVGFKSQAGFRVIGSAFIAAPGLALSATHVFTDYMEAMSNGTAVPYAIGIDQEEARFWKVTSVNTVDNDDIALITIEAASALPRNRTYYQFALTTRSPNLGETLQVFGFRSETVAPGLHGNLIAASGQVQEVHPNGRDRFLLPYPVIEISAGSHGGMSGGVALDASGHVLGVISAGMNSAENTGPTYVAWVIKALARATSINWPPGLYPKPASLIEVDKRLAMIEGRDAIIAFSDTELQYRPWHNPDEKR